MNQRRLGLLPARALITLAMCLLVACGDSNDSLTRTTATPSVRLSEAVEQTLHASYRARIEVTGASGAKQIQTIDRAADGHLRVRFEDGGGFLVVGSRAYAPIPGRPGHYDVRDVTSVNDFDLAHQALLATKEANEVVEDPADSFRFRLRDGQGEADVKSGRIDKLTLVKGDTTETHRFSFEDLPAITSPPDGRVTRSEPPPPTGTCFTGDSSGANQVCIEQSE